MLKAKKFRSQDVNLIHGKAANITVPWNAILRPNIFEWLTLHEKATNCSVDLVMPAALSLTSTLCGPNTRVESSPGVPTSLNLFVISTSPPGSGKSIVYDKIIQEVASQYSQRHGGKTFKLEGYTTAGLQKHQQETSGYGLISSDEGHRLLAAINLKQSKGECERALLCKMWGGAGDNTMLSTGTRGFGTTSMSLACYVQPQPLLTELSAMSEDDGFLDRVLIFAAFPKLFKAQVIRDNMDRLQHSTMNNLNDVFRIIEESHRKGKKTYSLSEDALRRYDQYNDSYVDFVCQRWNGTQGMPGEHGEGYGDGSDDAIMDFSHFCSSKDTLHVLRLAANLHVFMSAWDSVEANLPELDVSSDINLTTMNAAIALYTAVQQQKTIFVQAANNGIRDEVTISTKNCKTIKERVISAISNTTTPITTPRIVQKKLNSVTTEVIQSIMEECARETFGVLVTNPPGTRLKHAFMKPFPNEDANTYLMRNGTTDIAGYQRNFVNTSDMSQAMRDLVQTSHPQAELIIDIL